MLEVKHLTIRKMAEDRTLIEDLSFVLNPYDKFAIIGLEGIGKSTLLKVIEGHQTLDYIEYSGTINRKDLRIGYLPQNTTSLWGHETTTDFLLKQQPENEIRPEDYSLLRLLDKTLVSVKFDLLVFEEQKRIMDYSGGEIVKLAIAKLLLREPDILLLDEPTNDLDLDTILFLEDFINQEERPILYISHDDALLEHTANGIIHLVPTHKTNKAINIVSKCSYREYVHARSRSLDSQETIARKQRADHKKKMERFHQVYQRVEHLQNQAVRAPSQGRLLKKKMKSLKSQEFRYEREQEEFLEIPEREEEINLFFSNTSGIANNKLVLDYEQETVSVNDTLLAQNINLIIKGPEKIAIIGKNGVGKTTFLKKIVKDISKNKTLTLGYMSQQYRDVLNPEDNVLEAIRFQPDKEYETKIRTMLGSLHFTSEEMLYQIQLLSGGQIAKLMLLRLVLMAPDVLVLDEPTRNLSPLSLPVIHELLKQYKGCIICVSHDRNFIEDVFDCVYQLEEDGLEEIN